MQTTPFRVLLVWPRFPPSFWSWQDTVDAVGRKATVSPLGLITVAAMCPPHWQLRLIDEAVEPIRDEDILAADLVMVSAMEIQKQAVAELLARVRRLGRRSVIGGPYATSHSQALVGLADHVVAGEVEERFSEVAAAIEAGRAEPLYVFTEKPDVSQSPVPRFDLLKLDAYTGMSVQFSRGCPFQCEFCDIIVLYGRKPRTKPPEQLLKELDALKAAGWGGEVFIVDDNFIGNHVRAKELLVQLKGWQQQRGYPFSFYTEASVNLSQRVDLMQAMVEANFQYVFLGLETPSEEALSETRKFQNLKGSLLDSVRTIQDHGIWVIGGFIVGFDADDATIFERQLQFIEAAAIPWAMVGLLHALRNTALYDRLKKEDRLLPEGSSGDNLSLPNFRTVLSPHQLVGGYAFLLRKLYSPKAYFQRALRSLEQWKPRSPQRPPKVSWRFALRGFLGGIWHLGLRSHYRAEFWRTFASMLWRWWWDPVRMYHGFSILLAGRHLISYSETLIGRFRQAELLD